MNIVRVSILGVSALFSTGCLGEEGNPESADQIGVAKAKLTNVGVNTRVSVSAPSPQGNEVCATSVPLGGDKRVLVATYNSSNLIEVPSPNGSQ